MKPIVLDCSVTIAWCFQDESSDYSDQILAHVRKHSALVPQLWLSEVTNVLAQAIKKKRMDLEGSLFFLEKISRLPIRVASISSREYFSEIYSLALDEGLSTYDACYLALAKRERTSLATVDAALRCAGRRYKLPKLKL